MHLKPGGEAGSDLEDIFFDPLMVNKYNIIIKKKNYNNYKGAKYKTTQ